MVFGNPYADEYNEDILLQWAAEIAEREIKIISLADTVGMASPEQISFALNTLIPMYRDVEFGVHLHSSPVNKNAKLDAALNAGCKRFDGALKGIGGCPMAHDDLVGNIDTEWLISYLEQYDVLPHLNKTALAKSSNLANELFTL